MSRLIDADDVKELLLGLDSLPWEEEVDDLVNTISTSYDVDKVVTELEKGLKNLEHNKKLFEANQAERGVFMCDSEITAFKMAIDIVRKGGINDQRRINYHGN